jgi:uncharacterized membrane protein
MGTLHDAKLYGGIGSILAILNFVPSIGFVLAIFGFILVLVAVKYISEAVADNTIFTNVLYAVIAGILAVLVLTFVVAAAFFTFAGLAGGAGSNFIDLLLGAITGLVVVWVISIFGAYFLWKSYGKIAIALNVGLFRTTGLLVLVGAALTVIGVGFIILFVALILQIIAFFSLPEQPTTPHLPPSPPQQMTIT